MCCSRRQPMVCVASGGLEAGREKRGMCGAPTVVKRFRRVESRNGEKSFLSKLGFWSVNDDDMRDEARAKKIHP